MSKPCYAKPTPVVAGQFSKNIGRRNDPGVIRQPAAWIRPLVVVDQLTRRRNSVLVRLEDKVARVFDEMEQMNVRAAEIAGAVDAERVIPDDPTAAVKADLLALDLQFSGIFIADRKPESPLLASTRCTAEIHSRDQERYSSCSTLS